GPGASVPFLLFVAGTGRPRPAGGTLPHLMAGGRGDEAAPFELLPRDLVLLGSDEGEHFVLASVLTDEGRGQAQTAPGLQARGQPEDRRRQQVHLVVDDQTPVLGIEELEVEVGALPPGRQNLV